MSLTQKQSLRILLFEDLPDEAKLIIDAFLAQKHIDFSFEILWIQHWPDDSGERASDGAWVIRPEPGSATLWPAGIPFEQPIRPNEIHVAVLDALDNNKLAGTAFMEWLADAHVTAPVVLTSRHWWPADLPPLPGLEIIPKERNGWPGCLVTYVLDALEAGAIPVIRAAAAIAEEKQESPLIAFWRQVTDTDAKVRQKHKALWCGDPSSREAEICLTFFEQLAIPRTALGACASFQEDPGRWPELLKCLTEQKQGPDVLWLPLEQVGPVLVSQIESARAVNGGSAADSYPLIVVLADRVLQTEDEVERSLLRHGAIVVPRSLPDDPLTWLTKAVVNLVESYAGLWTLDRPHRTLDGRSPAQSTAGRDRAEASAAHTRAHWLNRVARYYSLYLPLLLAGRQRAYVYPHAEHPSIIEGLYPMTLPARVNQSMEKTHKEWRDTLVRGGIITEATAKAFR
jgi:hypothetical protein